VAVPDDRPALTTCSFLGRPTPLSLLPAACCSTPVGRGHMRRGVCARSRARVRSMWSSMRSCAARAPSRVRRLAPLQSDLGIPTLCLARARADAYTLFGRVSPLDPDRAARVISPALDTDRATWPADLGLEDLPHMRDSARRRSVSYGATSWRARRGRAGHTGRVSGNHDSRRFGSTASWLFDVLDVSYRQSRLAPSGLISAAHHASAPRITRPSEPRRAAAAPPLRC